jgi:hypothetical protein
MPKTVLNNIDDIVQIRAAIQECIALAAQLGWTREETACWLSLQADKLVEEDG